MRILSTISAISDFSLAKSRSPSLSVTPNHLVRNNMEFPSAQLGNEFDGSDAWQKAVGCRFGRYKACEPRHLDGRRTVCLRNLENAFRRVLSGDHGILRFRVQPDRPCEFAVVYPMSQHELILILDTGVDEISEEAALDAIVRLLWIVVRTVRHATTDQPVSVIAAAWLSLTRDRLASGVDAA